MPPVSASPFPTTAPTPPPAPGKTPGVYPTDTPGGPQGLEWTAIPLAAEPSDSYTLVANDASGVIVIGRIGNHFQRWFSTDGLTWDMAPIPPFDRASHKYMYWGLLQVVHLHDQFIGVATAEKPDHIQFWTSADGTDWTQVPDNSDFAFAKASELSQFEPGVIAGCCGEVTDIRIDGNVLVVDGSPPRADPCDICSFDPRTAVVRWTSSDGLHWDRAVVRPEYADTGREIPIETATGFIRIWRSQDEEHVGIEASIDRQSWAVVWQTTGYLRALHAFSGGYLAVGGTSYSDPQIIAAYSVDGTQWTQTAGLPDMQGALFDFVEFHGRLVAIGHKELFADNPVYPPYVWVSPRPN